MNFSILVGLLLVWSAHLGYGKLMEAALLSGAPRTDLDALPSGWTELELVEPATPLKFVVALKQQNLDILEEKFWAVSTPGNALYGKHMDMDEISDLIAPIESDMKIVENWANSHGFDYEVHGSGDFIDLYTTAASAQDVFGCAFKRFSHSTGVTIVRCDANSPYELPDDVARVVDFVGGIHRFPSTWSSFKSTVSDGLGVTPDLIRKLYGVGDVEGQASGNKQAVAQFLKQWYSQTDLDEFFLLHYRNSLGQKPTVVGENKFPAGTEASLDIQYIMSVGANISTEFWSDDNLHENQEPFLEWILKVGNDTTPPLVFSVSYGDDEDSVTYDYASRCNVEFQKQGLRGISLLFASGDDGAGSEGNGTTNGCKFDPNFPVSSPYVTVVGGTTLGILESLPETVNYLSGGGFSNYFPRPAYQDAAVTHYLANNNHTLPPASYFNVTGRAYPDVSALSQGFEIVVNKIPLPGVAGTSCATPTFSGVISLVNDVRLQKGQPALGFLNPLFYQLGGNKSLAFTDMLQGFNPGCDTNGFPAVPGWEPSGGWGSPNYLELIKALGLN
eukprot:Phypoly_transcript_02536.p1 GENE.Phypoly_transcript_02536~~Phypoly_transcript_02536.p1  ORF type:complete len:559 (+),score=75.66 Phypoly_transcript_02536:150-1826(+)